MRSRFFLFILFFIFAAPFAFTGAADAEGKYDKYREVFEPLPAIPPIPADNQITPDKVRLGKMLYWDRRTSKTGATSCGFCHHPAYYGAEPMRKSVGINGEIHKRNAQTVLNAAFLERQFWAGESPTLEHQALGAIKSHVASRSWPKEVAQRLNRQPEYKALAMKVYGEPLTEENIGKSIATFMRTLITPNYPLARWLKGDENAMTTQQKRGMALFADKGCIACHAPPNFSNSSYQKIIVPGGEGDFGLYKRTKKEGDKYKFKVPSLLNVSKTAPYTHKGMVNDLPSMVRLMGNKMLRTELKKNEVNDIVAFLHSLTGEMPQHFLTMPVLPTGGGEGDFGPGLTPSGKN
jgi:cytochrome c peroxidase